MKKIHVAVAGVISVLTVAALIAFAPGGPLSAGPNEFVELCYADFEEHPRQLKTLQEEGITTKELCGCIGETGPALYEERITRYESKNGPASQYVIDRFKDTVGGELAFECMQKLTE
jgi:hypothetical protein